MKLSDAKKKEIARRQIERRMQRRAGRRIGRDSESLREEDRGISAMGGYLIGGQAKLDKNKNNRIDAEDFKILRGEKKKPGKMMKARRGTIIKPKGPGVIRPKPQDRYGQPMKPKPIKPRIQKKMGGGVMKKPMMAKKGKAVMIVIGMKPKKKMGGGLMEATQRLKAQGKMGGGMMMKKPMGYDKGEMIRNPARPKDESELQKKVDRDALIRKARSSINKQKLKMKDRLTSRDKQFLKQKDRLTDRDFEFLFKQADRFKPQGKMGGGMMMRPNPVGMKSGKSVKVKCKIGRNKPTKMY